MNMDPANLSKLVPGFDFLQGLVKNAGSALPGIGQWVAPTLDPQELEKRIEELRTVQYWLEQNARLLGTTIQALEVQRMTLSTLETMNVRMGELRESLKARPPGEAHGDPASSPPAAATAPAAAPAVDPMQWWAALTQQFSQLAAGALKDSATAATPEPAGAPVKQSTQAASHAKPTAADAPKTARGGAPAKRKRAPAKR